MAELFVGITSGSILLVQNDPIRTPEGLQAGFLLGPGTYGGESKLYAIFQVGQENGSVTFVRPCTRAEKKTLAKVLYHYRAIRSIRTSMEDEEKCKLFFVR